MEIRAAGAAIFSRIFACGSDDIRVLSYTSDSEETHLTLANYDGKIKLRIDSDKSFEHIYKIMVMNAET